MKELDEQLSDILNEYAKNVTDKVNALTETTARSLQRELAASAPVGKRKKLKKSFKISKEKLGGISLKATVHSTEYRLLHLVENGHLTRDGTSRSQASHFIQKAVEKTIPEFEKAVEKAVKS